MVDVVRDYYQRAAISENIIKNKIQMFERNAHIKREFEHWIKTKEFFENEQVVVQGYSAKQISEMSKYMIGEGAFVMLIELRENPENALKKIKNGFRMI